jgi:Spy/CpxP family protein refolding chaperone
MFSSKLSKWSVLAIVAAALLVCAVPFSASAQTTGTTPPAATPGTGTPTHRHHRHHRCRKWHRHHRHHFHAQSGQGSQTAPNTK